MDENFCIQRGFSRLNSLNPQFSYYDWYFDKVKGLDNYLDLKFYEILPQKHLGYIDVPTDKISGTAHHSYQNLYWIEMLGGLKRHMHKNCEQIKEMIYGSLEESIGLIKVGEGFFIAGENHRNCFAKFLGIEYLNLRVSEYSLDERSYNLIKHFRKRNFLADFSSLNGEINWDFKFGEFSIRIYSSELTEKFVVFYDSIKITIKELIRFESSRLISPLYEKYIVLREEGDIGKTYQILIKHKLNL